MSTFCQYIAIFKTTLIESVPKIIVSKPIKIEYFNGPRIVYAPPKEEKYILTLPAIGDSFFIPAKPAVGLLLDEMNGPYLSITARTKVEVQSYKSTQFCNNHIDATIAFMSFQYSPWLFAKQIYRGRLLEVGEIHNEDMTLVTNPVFLNDELADSLTAGKLELIKNSENYSRYLLMTRFYSKSTLIHPSEEKFIYLWTMLEIFPMMGTSHINPISEVLGNHLNKEPNLVKEKLGIGKLFGYRSNLIHDGALRIPGEVQHEIFERLELICLEFLRLLNGLSYAGALDKYFPDPT